MSRIITQVDELITRVEILRNCQARIIDELKDNPARHLLPCKCGRGTWTRFDVCVLCFGERLRQEQL